VHSNKTMGWTTGVRFPEFQDSLLFATTHPFIKWLLRPFLLGYSCRGVKLTTDLNQTPKLKMGGAIVPLPHTSALLGT